MWVGGRAPLEMGPSRPESDGARACAQPGGFFTSPSKGRQLVSIATAWNEEQLVAAAAAAQLR